MSAIDAERRHILLTRGAINSDKYRDMERVGIRHDRYHSPNLGTIRTYREEVDHFNAQFGWLYSYEGKFTGDPKLRPVSEGGALDLTLPVEPPPSGSSTVTPPGENS